MRWQEAQGIPFSRFMHELHALPALFPVADVAGALQPSLLARHVPSARAAAVQAVGFGAAWVVVQEANRLATGAVPYSILVHLPLRGRLALDAACLLVVAAIAVAVRATIIFRAGAPAKLRRE